MSITELKAKAYDLLALMERAQLELKQVNEQIAVESNKQAEALKDEE